ncbi:hypothetical protein J2T02_002850 [Chitinophaga terrae (ex Kim and Jung 2007)]|uniref:hypothetical protein n=1 Tax=Chitinophaga terrae (ex Kim and Jung 2007) TaxID=408074 RepID=UPI00278B47D6|nr:hypothetical protein [Chitinophaga terrae (ex Kim and Jung 2007)]MDQ0107729.1 hypothetical protein [Chitinophaga terrae (ex Kim and Jung 2007)]
MTVDNITTIIIAVAFFAAILSPVSQFIKALFYNPKKLTIKSKSGEIVELDLEKKDIDAMIRFLDVLLEYK